MTTKARELWTLSDLVAELRVSDATVRRRLRDVFGDLDRLKPGTEIVLTDKQAKYFLEQMRKAESK